MEGSQSNPEPAPGPPSQAGPGSGQPSWWWPQLPHQVTVDPPWGCSSRGDRLSHITPPPPLPSPGLLLTPRPRCLGLDHTLHGPQQPPPASQIIRPRIRPQPALDQNSLSARAVTASVLMNRMPWQHMLHIKTLSKRRREGRAICISSLRGSSRREHQLPEKPQPAGAQPVTLAITPLGGVFQDKLADSPERVALWPAPVPQRWPHGPGCSAQPPTAGGGGVGILCFW